MVGKYVGIIHENKFEDIVLCELEAYQVIIGKIKKYIVDLKHFKN